jgi:putative heme-binding domain-containing protein
VKLAKAFDGSDRAYLEAVGLGATGCESRLYEALTAGQNPETWSDALAGLVWRLHPPEAVSAIKSRLLAPGIDSARRRQMLTALAFIPTQAAAGAMLAVAHESGFAEKELAKWWLLNRKGNDWKRFNIDSGMKAMGLYDADKVELIPVEMPVAAAEGAPTLPPIAEIVKLSGDPKRGETAAAVCFSCHKVGDQGVEFGPDLTAFGQQQPIPVIVQAIALPSAEISHGYEGSVVTTKDGLKIHGMILVDGDPLIVKSVGGLVQTVPRARVESVQPMTRSLMFDPAMMGLDAQKIADIAAYIKRLRK